MLSSKVSTLYKLEFRHLLKSGTYNVNGSMIHQEDMQGKKEVSGNIKVDGEFEGKLFDKNINYGLHLNRLFDKTKTYLKKYKISDDEILNSQIYINNQKTENNGKSHFLSLESLFFQDLRPDFDSSLTPNILPLIRYNQLYPLKFLDTKIELNSAFYNIWTRSQDTDTNIMNDISFNNKFITENGHEFNIKNGIYTYLHQYNSVNFSNKNYINKTNIVPYSKLRWSYEVLTSTYRDTIIIEPIASLMVAPNKFFSQEPDLLEIRKSNFFAHNRFLDLESADLVSRFDYGLNFLLKNKSIDALNVFVGSSFYLKKHSFENQKKHNYISATSLQLNQFTFLVNRMWFDRDNLKIIQHEIDSIFTFKKTNFGLGYTYERQLKEQLFPQEISGYIDFNFYKKWWIHFDANIKLNNINDSRMKSQSINSYDKKKLLKDGIGLSYKDDCLQVDFAVNRDHTKMKDLKPSTTYIMKVGIPIFNKL